MHVSPPPSPLRATAVALVVAGCSSTPSSSPSDPAGSDAGTDAPTGACQGAGSWDPVTIADPTFPERTIGNELGGGSAVSPTVAGLVVAGGKVFVVGIGEDPASNNFGKLAFLAYASDVPGASFKVVPIAGLVGARVAMTSSVRDGVEYVEIAGTRTTPAGDQDLAAVWELDAAAYDGAPLGDAQRIVQCTPGSFTRPLLASTRDGDLVFGVEVVPDVAGGHPTCTVRGKSVPFVVSAASATVLFAVDGPLAGSPPHVVQGAARTRTSGGELAIAGLDAHPRMFLTSIFEGLAVNEHAFDWSDASEKVTQLGDMFDRLQAHVTAVGSLGVFGGNYYRIAHGSSELGKVKLATSAGTSLVDQDADPESWLAVRAIHGAGGRLAVGGGSSATGLTLAGTPVTCARDHCAFAASVSFSGAPRVEHVVTLEGRDPSTDRAATTAVFVGPCGELYAGGVFEGNVDLFLDGVKRGALTNGGVPAVARASLPFVVKMAP